MIRTLLAGLWGVTVAIVAAYVGMTMQGAGGDATVPHGKAAHAAGGMKQIATDQISVPIIVEGKVQGYVLAKLTFTVDGDKAAHAPGPLQSYLLDETLRAFYAGQNIDFRRLTRLDLPALAQTIVAGVNTRLKSAVVTDALIQDLNYVPIENVRRGGAPAPR